MRICSWLPYFVESSVVTADQQLLPAQHGARGQRIACIDLRQLLAGGGFGPPDDSAPRGQEEVVADAQGSAGQRAVFERDAPEPASLRRRSRASGRRRWRPRRCRRREPAPRRIDRRGPLRCRGPAPAGRARSRPPAVSADENRLAENGQRRRERLCHRRLGQRRQVRLRLILDAEKVDRHLPVGKNGLRVADDRGNHPVEFDAGLEPRLERLGQLLAALFGSGSSQNTWPALHGHKQSAARAQPGAGKPVLPGSFSQRISGVALAGSKTPI